MAHDQRTQHNYFSPSTSTHHQWESSGGQYFPPPDETQSQSQPLPPLQSDPRAFYYPPPQQAQPTPMIDQNRLSDQGLIQQQGYFSYQGQQQPQYPQASSARHSAAHIGGQLPSMTFSSQDMYWNQQPATAMRPTQPLVQRQNWSSSPSTVAGVGPNYLSHTTLHQSLPSGSSQGRSGQTGFFHPNQYGSSGDRQILHHDHPRPIGQGSGTRPTPAQYSLAPAPHMASLDKAASRLPAKPTFEPAGGIQPPLGIPSGRFESGAPGATPKGSLVVPSSSSPAMPGKSKSNTQSKSSSSMGTQLLEKLPPLPSLPTVTERPTRLSEGEEQTRSYLSSLLELIDAYKAREEAMQLRIEALAFRPVESWRSITAEMAAEMGIGPPAPATTATTGTTWSKVSTSAESDGQGPAPVLGVRLLGRIYKLQTQNNELEVLLSQKLHLSDDGIIGGVKGKTRAADRWRGHENRGEPLDSGHVQTTEKTSAPSSSATVTATPITDLDRTQASLEDAHRLLTRLSTAFAAERARAQRAERALEATVKSQSTSL